MKRFTLLAALSFALLPSWSVAAETQGLTPKEILIGTQVSLTGPASSVGQGFKAGLDLAVDEINSHGGINGRTIKIVYEDDAGTAEGGISAVRRLMDQDKVFAIFGGGTSTSTSSVIPLIQQANFLYYDSLASDPRVLDKYSPYVFSGMTVVRSDVAAVVVRVMARDFKAKTVGFLTSDEAFCSTGITLMEPKIAAAGMKLIVQEKFKTGDTDFTAQSAALKAANADAVYVCGLPSDGGRMLPQLKRNGVTSKLLVDTVLTDPVVTKTAGTAIEGTYGLWISANQFIEEKTGPIADWKARFARKNPNPVPGTPNSYSLASYGDFYVFAEGLRRAGKDLTQDKVVTALESIHDYVAGKDRAFSYAAAIGNPRTFSKGDHKGSRDCVPVVVRNGEYQRVERT